jgi:hypothetical protein
VGSSEGQIGTPALMYSGFCPKSCSLAGTQSGKGDVVAGVGVVVDVVLVVGLEGSVRGF